MTVKKSRLTSLLIVLGLLGIGLAVFGPMIGSTIRSRRLSVQAEWKASAVQRISRLSSDPQWLTQSKADLAKIRVRDDMNEPPMSEDMILLKNDEWLVCRSIAGKEDWRFDDIFIAKASDGRWYYSTYHFCIGMIVLHMRPHLDSLDEFKKAYFLREFSGDPTAPMPRTWPLQDETESSTDPVRGDRETGAR